MKKWLTTMHNEFSPSFYYMIAIISFLGGVAAFVMSLIDSYMVVPFFLEFSLGLLCIVIVGYKPDEPETPPYPFLTVDQNGKIVVYRPESDQKPLLDYAETPRADGGSDVRLDLHSKEEAVTALAVLALVREDGKIDDGEYHRVVRIIRENFEM